MTELYLKSAFQNWMKAQLISDRTHSANDRACYRPSTVNAYSTALKNATKKLNLDGSVKTDIFCYSSLPEFDEAYARIHAAPNFKEVDRSAGNAAYSNALVLYRRFLEEYNAPAAWIFQGNAKYYDVVKAVNELDTIAWSVNQHQKQIKKGDKAYIWLSGADGGIVASGIITNDPELREADANDPYYLSDTLNQGPHMYVDIQLERKFTDTPVLRSVLKADERTKKMEILTYASATNFHVTAAQAAVIESLLDGTYVCVPAVDEDTDDVETAPQMRYWVYSPGEDARLWDEFRRDGIIGIGWDELGDLSRYQAKEDIRAKLFELNGGGTEHTMDALANWQFANVMQAGDVVFAKKGRSKVIGRGVVSSDYIFAPERGEYQSIRKVDWTAVGDRDYDGQLGMKTLTDITLNTGMCAALEEAYETENMPIEMPSVSYEPYTKEDFLNDVFLDAAKYDTLKGLLLRKKNIILQGAPGVGKTFSARRLAYSIMGEKDESRVQFVQFHQSYCYEDFIMGFRPDGDKFKITNGPFYQFCKRAGDDGRPYFFIIDEINRGNLSKIFGELMMLIEQDKRGEKHAIRLLYADEKFYVPENVYIIGMMNTADRSLALIDYALRRRFAFFEFEPAFQSAGFLAYQAQVANKKFDGLVSEVCALNRDIETDASLGPGFRIGHSYFCADPDSIDDEWLYEVVNFEIIPLISEYWFDEREKVEQWSRKLNAAVQ